MATTKGSPPNEDFVFELEENAKDSLQHGIDHLLAGDDPSNLKQAILQVFHAVELFLKARLAKEHPTLIFEKPELADCDDAHTVGFELAVKRLRAAGVTFAEPEWQRLKHLQLVRNHLEHHKYKGNSQTVRDLIAGTIKALEGLLSQEFGIDWNDFLTPESRTAIEEMIFSYQERLEKATERVDAVTNGDPKSFGEDIETCQACGEDTVPCPDPKSPGGQTRCYFCDEPYFINHCDRCETRVLSDVPWDEKFYPNHCESCEDYYKSQ